MQMQSSFENKKKNSQSTKISDERVSNNMCKGLILDENVNIILF